MSEDKRPEEVIAQAPTSSKTKTDNKEPVLSTNRLYKKLISAFLVSYWEVDLKKQEIYQVLLLHY